MRRILILMLAALVASPSFAAEGYRPSPIQLLEERVDQHDKEIDSLKKRVAELEAEQLVVALTAQAAEIVESKKPVPKPVPDPIPNAAPVIVQRVESFVPTPVSPPVVHGGYCSASRSYIVGAASPYCSVSRSVIVSQPVYASAAVVQPVQSGTRWKTTSELSAAIRSNWTNRVYGRMARGQDRLVYQHLTGEHGYSSSQVSGLPLSEALMLHNLAHGPKISPYASGTSYQSQPVVQRAEFFTPTPNSGSPAPAPRPAPVPRSNCPDGKCPLVGRASGSSSGGWYPGKLLFRR